MIRRQLSMFLFAIVLVAGTFLARPSAAVVAMESSSVPVAPHFNSEPIAVH